MSDLADALKNARSAIEDVWTVVADVADADLPTNICGDIDAAEDAIESALRAATITP